MNYVEQINELLRPKSQSTWVALDLFAGCGGLSLGFEAVGFQTVGYELEKRYAETYSKNLNGVCYEQRLTSTTDFEQSYDIVIGGPPCQPFSVGGHQKGIDDARNGFPAFINAIKKVKPKLWVFENVRGMLYANKWYLEEVIAELEQEGYIIDYKLLNAVQYGVPQNRERLFVVGHKGGFQFPKPLLSKTTVGEAIGELVETIQDESKILTASMDQYVANYEKASSCINPTRPVHA